MNRIRQHLQLPQASLVLSDMLLTDQSSGKLTAVGLCDRFLASEFPAHFRLAMVAKVWGLASEADNFCRFYIVDIESGETVYDSPVHQFSTDGSVTYGVQHTSANVDDVAFPGPGGYELRVVVNGAVAATMPLYVEEVDEEDLDELDTTS